MKDHIGIADRLDLAAGRAHRITGRITDDMDRRLVMPLLAGQQLDNKGVRAGLVAVDDPAGRIAVDDPVLQSPPAGGGQGPDALPDAVQIKCKPAVTAGKPVLDGGAKPPVEIASTTGSRSTIEPR